MMMDLSTNSAATTMHTILTLHRNMAEPLDCSSPILDLCIRRRPRTPSPEIESKPIIFPDVPTSTAISVSSTSPGSDTSETSTSSDLYRDVLTRPTQTSLTTKMKVPRPFKAYPKDPLSFTAGVAVAVGKNSVDAYAEFRNRMLSQVQATHGITNKNMRRTTQGANNSREDPTYWEKRRKNNEAAKRSRDARRAKEDEIAIRAAFLEQENIKLRYEVATLRNELEKLRSVLYSHPLA